jgi:FixJ family two-component response regulator
LLAICLVTHGKKCFRRGRLIDLFETLTSREREVLALVAAGLMNKQIAAELGLAEIIVKIHRGHIMKKMGSRSLADLVRKAETLGIHRIKP